MLLYVLPRRRLNTIVLQDGNIEKYALLFIVCKLIVHVEKSGTEILILSIGLFFRLWRISFHILRLI